MGSWESMALVHPLLASFTHRHCLAGILLSPGSWKGSQEHPALTLYPQMGTLGPSALITSHHDVPGSELGAGCLRLTF